MALRITTINLNGIRAAGRKSFFEWLKNHPSDIVCLQETKAQLQYDKSEAYYPQDYYCYYFDAEKPGYAGVGIYCRREPDRVLRGLGIDWIDQEGRYIQVDYGHLSVVSLYLPSGTSGEHRQRLKFQFMDQYPDILKRQLKEKRSYIICGDWNIAHKKIDLKNWRSNQKNSGFLPEERAWLDKLFDEIGYVDAFRVVNQEAEQYTWWSYRGRAWEKNVGWRIDYQILTPDLKDKVHSSKIYSDTRFSDHAPLVLDYDIDL